MPRIFWAESFEYYGVGQISVIGPRMRSGLWAEVSGAGASGAQPSITTTDGARTGARFLSMSSQIGATQVVRRAGFGLRNTVGVAFGYRAPTLPNAANTQLFSFRDLANASLITVAFQPDGTMVAYSGTASGDVIGIANEQIVAGAWEHIEIIATISTTVGALEVRKNGVPMIQVGDLNLGTTPIAQVRWAVSNNGNTMQLDDIVTHDGSDFIGVARVLTVFPEADATPFDWSVIGAASGTDAVTETAPDEDSSYIGTAFEGDVATFTMPELPVDIVELISVVPITRLRQEEAGTTHVQLSYHSESESEEGEVHPATEAYVYYIDAFDRDPNTDERWTREAFESALLRVTRVA